MSEDFTFDEYQEATKKTADYPSGDVLAGVNAEVIYTGLGVSGEAGEVTEKIKKAMREGEDEYLDQLEDELGDVLWYIARLCDELGLNMGDVAENNIEKLLDRQERGVIKGQGDNR